MMGLLDDIGRQVFGDVFANTVKAGSAAPAPGKVDWLRLGIAVLDRYGGIEGVMKQFSQKGMADVASSWVGTGRNAPISAEQILEALGRKNVAEVAREAGTDAKTAADRLAQVLPGIIDKLTPKGRSIGGDALQQGISALLGGKLGDLGKLFR